MVKNTKNRYTKFANRTRREYFIDRDQCFNHYAYTDLTTTLHTTAFWAQ